MIAQLLNREQTMLTHVSNTLDRHSLDLLSNKERLCYRVHEVDQYVASVAATHELSHGTFPHLSFILSL